EHPDVTIAFDSNPAAAAATRKRLLERVATDKLIVSGMHFNAPITATVKQAAAQQFTLHYDGWSPVVYFSWPGHRGAPPSGQPCRQHASNTGRRTHGP
ncbi:hypothetical protein ACWCRI_38215, partial [Streptomyces collinus]